jgi:hypothetical protein
MLSSVCRTAAFVLREEERLTVFESKLFRISVSKTDLPNKEAGKRENKELHHLYY